MSWEIVVWGKEVPARWRWLQPGPEGVGEICQRQLPFLYPAKEKGSFEQSHFTSIWLPPVFISLCFFPPVLKVEYPTQPKFILSEMQTWKWKGVPCHGGSMTVLQSTEGLCDACFSLKVPSEFEKEERMGPGKQEHNDIYYLQVPRHHLGYILSPS